MIPLQRVDGPTALNHMWHNESHLTSDQPPEQGVPITITWSYGGIDVAVEGSICRSPDHDHFEDKGTYGDSPVVENLRGIGVQFPFVVTDRVVIKGNKRTPERFVGREAVVTTQCLNGWRKMKDRIRIIL